MLAFQFAVVLLLAQPGQPEALPSLCLLEEVAPPGENEIYVNLSLVLIDPSGKLQKQTLFERVQRMFGYGASGTRLIDNRFVISTYGAVVDLKSKKIMNDEMGGSLLGVESGGVFYKKNDGKNTSLIRYDLQSQKREQIRDWGHWRLSGVKSPDNKSSLVERMGSVLLYRLDGSQPARN